MNSEERKELTDLRFEFVSGEFDQEIECLDSVFDAMEIITALHLDYVNEREFISDNDCAFNYVQFLMAVKTLQTKTNFEYLTETKDVLYSLEKLLKYDVGLFDCNVLGRHPSHIKRVKSSKALLFNYTPEREHKFKGKAYIDRPRIWLSTYDRYERECRGEIHRFSDERQEQIRAEERHKEEEIERKEAEKLERQILKVERSRRKGAGIFARKKLAIQLKPNTKLGEHITSRLQSGMTWGQRSEWHVDHIIPIAQFLENGIEDDAYINHPLNLDPLWAKDNLKKSASRVSQAEFYEYLEVIESELGFKPRSFNELIEDLDEILRSRATR